MRKKIVAGNWKMNLSFEHKTVQTKKAVPSLERYLPRFWPPLEYPM